MVDEDEVCGSFKPGGGGYDMMNGCAAKPFGCDESGTYLSPETLQRPRWVTCGLVCNSGWLNGAKSKHRSMECRIKCTGTRMLNCKESEYGSTVVQ